MKPNVLLIVFDTARADVFEPYGASTGSSPTVAQLASDGMFHPMAYAPASWTVPSHAALFTGMLPWAAGIHLGGQTPESFRQILTYHKDRLLQSVLAREGYRTVGISGNGWISEHAGFDLGFDEFHHITSGRHNALGADSLRSKLHWAVAALRSNLDDGATEILELLRQTVRKPQPFFCFVNLVECHSPYLPPKPFNSLGWANRIRSVADANRYCTYDAFWMQAFGASSVPEESELRMRRLYEDSIRQLDSWLSRVMTMIDSAGLLNDTHVIVTSDHGENFGEGGLTGHMFSLDDRLIRIPLVSSGPLELTPPPIMSLADLAGTLADALSLPDHPWITSSRSQHVAVAQHASPAEPGDEVAIKRLAERQIVGPAADIAFRSFECATDGHWKVLRDAEGDHVLDLTVDPLELRPTAVGDAVPSDDSGRIARLRHALDEAGTATMRLMPHVETAVSATDPEEKARLEEQMRLLGYL